jgi:hypothetical protein
VENELLSVTRLVTRPENDAESETKYEILLAKEDESIFKSAICDVCEPDTISNAYALNAIDSEYGDPIA